MCPWLKARQGTGGRALNSFTCPGMKGAQTSYSCLLLSPAISASPPTQPPLPSTSSHISCQKCDLLKPGCRRLQLQRGRYFYPAPASCTLAEALFAGVWFCHFPQTGLSRHIRPGKWVFYRFGCLTLPPAWGPGLQISLHAAQF